MKAVKNNENKKRAPTGQTPLLEQETMNTGAISEADSGSNHSFLIISLSRIAVPLTDLLGLDAVEIYLTERISSGMERIFHTGKLKSIWEFSAAGSIPEFLVKQTAKSEARTINLPNRRISGLAPSLREKAFGQVACMPIIAGDIPFGMLCAVHTRHSMLNENDQEMLASFSRWIAEVFIYERKSHQIRTQIITAERERIGMDLHDGIIQSLYGIGLSMENARLNLEQGKGDAVDQIEKSLDSLQAAIADIRAYILDLRPRQLRHANLFEGMRSLTREFRANTMVEVDLEGSHEEVEDLAREQVDALFHIFQEAITNTAKHARATKVSVRLWRRDGRVLLRINDNGQGFEMTKPGRRIGHGLANMRARAEGAGGGMEVVSIRRQGTTLLAWVPLVKEG